MLIRPCIKAIKGSLIGASQESSMDEPCVKAPAAIITLSVYPGMSHGSGIELESTGEPF